MEGLFIFLLVMGYFFELANGLSCIKCDFGTTCDSAAAVVCPETTHTHCFTDFAVLDGVYYVGKGCGDGTDNNKPTAVGEVTVDFTRTSCAEDVDAGCNKGMICWSCDHGVTCNAKLTLCKDGESCYIDVSNQGGKMYLGKGCAEKGTDVQVKETVNKVDVNFTRTFCSGSGCNSGQPLVCLTCDHGETCQPKEELCNKVEDRCFYDNKKEGDKSYEGRGCVAPAQCSMLIKPSKKIGGVAVPFNRTCCGHDKCNTVKTNHGHSLSAVPAITLAMATVTTLLVTGVMA